MNLEKSTVVGVDPYPHCEDEKLIMTNRMLELGASTRFTLYDSLDELPKGSLFHLVHIDGLHTEEQVQSDLAKVSKMLDVGGVIAVDDFTNPWFPGVQSAIYRFMLENDYRLFLVSMQKAYITRTDNAPVLWQLIRDIKEDFEFCDIYENAADMYPDHAYQQKTDVFGQPVLVSSPRIRKKNWIQSMRTLINLLSGQRA